MPIYLRQSTASQEVPLGYFLDSTDGNTEETALTIANTDIKLHKTGATTLASKTSGGATHMSNGLYYAVLDATDTDTAGSMIVYCHVAGALATRSECVVLPAQVYDSLILGTDLLDTNTAQWLGTACATPTVAGVPEVDVTHISGDAQSATDLKDFADAGYDPSTNKVQGVVLVDTLTTYTGNTVQTGDSYTRLGAPSGASMSADVAAIKSDTAAILLDTGTDGVAVIPAHRAASNSDYAQAGTVSSITLATGASSINDIYKGQKISICGGTGDGQTRGVANYNGTTKVANVARNWTVAPDVTSLYRIEYDFGPRIDQNLDVTVGNNGADLIAIPWNAAWDAEVQSECADALNAYDPPTNTEMVAAFTEIKGATWSSATDTIEHIRDKLTDIETDTAEIGAAGAGLTNINLPNQTMDIVGNITGNLSGSVGSVTSGVTVTTNNDKTGYALTQTFPANFASLAITAGGIVDADIESIKGDTGAATKLELVLSGNTTGTVGTGSTTTSIVTSALNPAASVTDQYKGLILKFDDATTTAALRGQGTDITASTAAGVLTVTALTTAPVSGDIFTVS